MADEDQAKDYEEETDYSQPRGGAVMEFLMTYGWAILVVLVAIGALAYFGVFK